MLLLILYNVKMEFKCNLKKLLKSKKMSMYKLQKATNITYPTLNKYRDDTILQYDKRVLAELCIALDCDISELLELTISDHIPIDMLKDVNNILNCAETEEQATIELYELGLTEEQVNTEIEKYFG